MKGTETGDNVKAKESKTSEPNMKSDKATKLGQSCKPEPTLFDFMREIVQPIVHEISQGIHHQQSHHNSSPTHHAEPACSSSETGERCPASDCYKFKTVPTWFGPMRVNVLKKCCKTPKAQNDKSDTKSQHSSKEDTTRGDDNTARSSESVKISNKEKTTSGTIEAMFAIDESKGGEPVVEDTWACQTDTDAQGNSTSDGFTEATPANKGDEGDLQTNAENAEPLRRFGGKRV